MMTEPFLKPVEKPKGAGMKLAYFFTRKKFGKVLMPLKVHSARLPAAFGMFYAKVAGLDEKLQLPAQMAQLIRQQVAQLNGCAFCIDAGRAAVISAAAMNRAKFDALADYINSPLFSEKERAGLDYVTALTQDRQVIPQTFERLAACFTEREICEIVYLVASEHLYNLTNIGLNIHSDGLCPVGRE